MVTQIKLPKEKTDHVFRNLLSSFFVRIRKNVQKEMNETVKKTEDKIYASVNKPVSKNPLDYPQIFINGLCKILDKILDGLNAVLRILFF